MDLVLMPTTERHMHLVCSLFADMKDALARKELLPLQENSALLYEGSLRDNMCGILLNAAKLNTIDWDLDFVYPDFMIFKDNSYVRNEKRTKFIGQPDLIVEVWSDHNTELDRNLKFNLYSSSPVTEHWYIKQDSNKVVCWLGSLKLESQTLDSLLYSQKGLVFDLRYLAL